MSETLFLIARIGGRTVAFSADQVDSAVDLTAITPVPRALPGVAGLAALRSRVVTVIDPRIVLGVPVDNGMPARAVVTQVEGHAYAVLVEALEDVAAYRPAPLPAGLASDAGGGWGGAGTAIVDRAGEPVLIVDLARLIPHAPALAA